MAKLTIEVPDSKIEEAAEKQIKILKHQVATLERKLAQVEAENREAKQILAANEILKEFICNHFNLYTETDCD